MVVAETEAQTEAVGMAVEVAGALVAEVMVAAEVMVVAAMVVVEQEAVVRAVAVKVVAG